MFFAFQIGFVRNNAAAVQVKLFQIQSMVFAVNKSWLLDKFSSAGKISHEKETDIIYAR